MIIRPEWDAPHVRCLPRMFCAWPCLLRQVGTVLGSPYDYVVAVLAYANPGSRHWRSFIHQVALRCVQLGASRCDCPRLCLVHTLWYDRARPRPRLSDRAGVSLCKGYEIVDSMVEATCL